MAMQNSLEAENSGRNSVAGCKGNSRYIGSIPLPTFR